MPWGSVAQRGSFAVPPQPLLLLRIAPRCLPTRCAPAAPSLLAAAYVIWGSATRQEFDAADPGAANQPFGWETALRSLLPAGSAASGGDAEAGAAEGERQAEARGGKGSGSKAKDE